MAEREKPNPRSTPARTSPIKDDTSEFPTRDFPMLAEAKESGQYDFSVGRYEIKETISIRKHSTVFKAYDSQLQRFVSLKLYPEHHPAEDHPKVVDEARALAKIDSPFVAKCFNVETIDETPVLVNEWIEGETLLDYMSSHELTFKQVQELFRQITEGVRAIHQQGLLHRDLKPSNVIVDLSGKAKVIDLGLAQPESILSENFSGTVSYIAPEVINGQAEKIGVASDIFGLGGILYFMLTGRPVFEADDRDEIVAQATSCEIQPSHIVANSKPNLLDEICEQCLQKDPQDRFSSTDAILRELAASPWPARLVPAAILLLIVAGIIALAMRPTDNTAADAQDNTIRPPEIAEVPDFSVKERAIIDGDFDKAITLCQGELADLDLQKRESYRPALECLFDLSKLHLMKGRVDESLQEIDQTLQLAKRFKLHPQRIRDMQIGRDETEKLKELEAKKLEQFARAKHLMQEGNIRLRLERNQVEVALAKAKQLYPLMEEAVGPDHLETADAMNLLAGCYYFSGHPTESLIWLDKAGNAYSKIFGDSSPKVATFLRNRGVVYLDWKGNIDRALVDLNTAKGITDRIYGENSLPSLSAEGSIGSALVRSREFERALNVLSALIPKASKYGQQGMQTVMVANYDRCIALFELGNVDEAQVQLDKLELALHEAIRKGIGVARFLLAKVLVVKAKLNSQMNQNAAAVELAADGIDLILPARAGTQQHFLFMADHAIYLARNRQFDEAALRVQQIIGDEKLEDFEHLFPPIHVRLAEVFARNGNPSQAASSLEAAMQRIDVHNFVSTWTTVTNLNDLAKVDQEQNDQVRAGIQDILEKVRKVESNERTPQLDRLEKLIAEVVADLDKG